MTFTRSAFAALGFLSLTVAASAAELVSFSGMPPGSFWETDDADLGKEYAYPKDMPNGPYYFVNDDKVTSIRFIMKQSDFEAGKSWPDIAPHAGLGSIDHISLNYQRTVWGDRFAGKAVYVLDIFFGGPEVTAAQ